MKTIDIKATIANISRTKWELDEALEENGGELTDELLEKCEVLEDLKALLGGEGVDELGRMLKSVQDEIQARKAEADAAARRVKNLKGYEDYLKFLINQALEALGEDKVKGAFYGFARSTSTKSSVNQEALEEKYGKIVEKVVREAQVPEFVQVVLKTTTTAIREAGALEFLEESNTPALKFTKPRASKE